MSKRSLPVHPLTTVSPDGRYCGQWATRNPITILLCAVMAEQRMIEAVYEEGGRIELSWDQNGPRIHCWVTHHVELACDIA